MAVMRTAGMMEPAWSSYGLAGCWTVATRVSVVFVAPFESTKVFLRSCWLGSFSVAAAAAAG